MRTLSTISRLGLAVLPSVIPWHFFVSLQWGGKPLPVWPASFLGIGLTAQVDPFGTIYFEFDFFHNERQPEQRLLIIAR